VPKLEKDAKRDKTLEAKLALLQRLQTWLAEGHRARRMEMSDAERGMVRDLHLLTMKPMLYVANVDEAQLGAPLEPIDGVEPIPICAKVEAELADLDPEDAAEYLESIGLEEPGLNRLIREAYRLLGLESFFTQSEKEVRAWTIPIGTNARRAAGVVHTDFERGFIKAEVASFEDFVRHGGEHGTKAAGRLRIEGKDYVVQDGDVILFRFNV
jgi:ribosome-binding ATPase YchF (GTP1/OBG family)